MCGGSRFMWPLSDAINNPSKGTAPSWPERLTDPADRQDNTDSLEDGIRESEIPSSQSETVV